MMVKMFMNKLLFRPIIFDELMPEGNFKSPYN
jgi:hypothetical protein